MGNKHISDELLAAFLEGNVSKQEIALVMREVERDEQLREVLNVALQIDDDALPMMQIAAESGRNLCDVQCEAYVLQHLDVNTSIEELFEVAKDKHWIRRAGTPLYCIGNLLEFKGLKVMRKYESKIEDICVALEKGNGVIVAVDCDKLYPERPDEEDATNHAIVVTAVNTDEKMIMIFDPENTTKIGIKLPLFIAAWKESHCYLVCAQK